MGHLPPSAPDKNFWYNLIVCPKKETSSLVLFFIASWREAARTQGTAVHPKITIARKMMGVLFLSNTQDFFNGGYPLQNFVDSIAS